MVKRWKYIRSMGRTWCAPLLGVWLLVGCGDEKLDFASLVDDENGRTRDSGPSTAEADTHESTVTRDVDPTDVAGSGTDAGGPLLDAAPPLDQLEPELTFDDAPMYSDYVRLTHQQWDNSVVDNLRLDAPTGRTGNMLPDPVARYSNNESVLWVSRELVVDYRIAAESIAQSVAGDVAALDKVHPSRDPRVFIEEVGRRFYRRPLSQEEVATYLTLFEVGAGLAPSEAEAFPAGAQLLLEAWMQAPSFLYRVEESEGLLNGYEVATRLTYLLTDSTPSDALLDAAGAGALDTSDGVLRAAKELLGMPRAELVFRRFHDETLALRRLESLHVEEAFGVGPDLNRSLIEVSHRYFDRVFRERLGLRELFLSEVGYVNATLAPLYGVPAPTMDGFDLVTLAPSRRGVFAQLPLLMVDSAGETPNLFRRGMMFTNYVLCQTIPEEPGSAPIPPTPPEDGPQTNRERSAAMVASEACQACHEVTDPFGVAFENFDGLGRERDTDNGLPVDTTGTYPFGGKPQFRDSTELMNILAESPLAHGCYAKNLTEFSLARSLEPRDAALVLELRAQSLDNASPLVDLVTSIVSSETFRSAGGSQ